MVSENHCRYWNHCRRWKEGGQRHWGMLGQDVNGELRALGLQGFHSGPRSLAFMVGQRRTIEEFWAGERHDLDPYFRKIAGYWVKNGVERAARVGEEEGWTRQWDWRGRGGSDVEWIELDVRGGKDKASLQVWLWQKTVFVKTHFSFWNYSLYPTLAFFLLLSCLPVKCWCHSTHSPWEISNTSWLYLPLTTPSWWLPHGYH